MTAERIQRAYEAVRTRLLDERNAAGHWRGELASSALSTATAISALCETARQRRDPTAWQDLIENGCGWLDRHQNDDGGWGDTVKSLSNISTTMLCHAVLVAVSGQRSATSHDLAGHPGPPISAAAPTKTSDPSTLNSATDRAQEYVDRAGGVPALVARYGKDKTFSVPILTHCALAGLVDWRQITPLPFELACVPARFYKTVRLPVVSYALPALIAIGQVRHHFAPTWNPVTRVLRNRAIEPSLKVLARIQPPNGGFLEATPLTSFVTMSLAAKGLVDHPVVRRGVDFIINSVRPDGSWPIDTNLATWVTTLSVNALGDDLPEESRLPILKWLLDQQYSEVHPYTNADPGGWAWTDLPGGVPDADDTPGAILAILELSRELRVESPERSRQPSGVGRQASKVGQSEIPPGVMTGTSNANARHQELIERVDAAIATGVDWLLGLQNRDGGFPTFCRGWGTLPFDRSSPDITAHCLRAMGSLHHPAAMRRMIESGEIVDGAEHPDPQSARQQMRQLRLAMDFLMSTQRRDGSWLPLWFGNQHGAHDENPTYGTAKVVHMLNEFGANETPRTQSGMGWLRSNQNSDGGWGAGPGTPSSVEETALAVEALLDDPHAVDHVVRGLNWLMDRVEAGTIAEPAPIGFYFAKLWYFERLYPLIFAVSCLRRAVQRVNAGS
ncbi:MAG: squalene--hopene cyclase [Planctomycetaceae bacterium]|nr:squalene--hopene cyclase [Planctomycetaceae bacterium]